MEKDAKRNVKEERMQEDMKISGEESAMLTICLSFSVRTNV